uniref:Uncharacterized protein n=1 Tax=Arundo donax TaxID=35708 RepID=A0A0A8Y6P4_ARUDO
MTQQYCNTARINISHSKKHLIAKNEKAASHSKPNLLENL